MNTQLKKSLVVVLIFAILIIVSLSSLTFASAQGLTSTPTLTLVRTDTPAPTATNTPSATVTITPSTTPTPSMTATPTPVYSAGTDIAEMKDLLKKIDSNTAPGNPYFGFVQRWAEDTFFNTMWKYLAEPLLAQILIVLAAIPLISKLSSWVSGSLRKFEIVKSNKPKNAPGVSPEIVPTDGHENIPAQSPEAKWHTVFRLAMDFVNMSFLVLVIAMLLPSAIAPSSTAASQLITPTSIAENISTITPVPSFIPAPTPPPTDEQKNRDAIIWFTVSVVVGVGILGLFAFLAGRIAKHQTKIYDVKFSKVNFQEIGAALLPAGFLVLILSLLPSPVDTILMPLLIPFFILAFFDVVRLYPNQYLKNIVVTHYSKIIFWAEFGVWFGFLSVIRDYTYPFWNIFRTFWENTTRWILDNQIQGILANQWIIDTKIPNDLLGSSLRSLPYSLPQFFWDFLPLLLAVIFTIGPWHHIRNAVQANHITKIRQSMKTK